MSLFVQSIAIVAVAIFLASYHMKTRGGILLLQMLSLFIWGIHLALLSAWTGMWLMIANIIFTAIFMVKEKLPLGQKFLVLPLLIFLLIMILTWEKYSIFAFLGVLFMTIAKWQDNPKKIRQLAPLSNINWIVYDYFVSSYGGILAEMLIIISIIISLRKNKT